MLKKKKKTSWQSATLLHTGHRSFKSQRKITGPALHHPLIPLTSAYRIVYLQHARVVVAVAAVGRWGDCISEGSERADMDGVEEVTWSDTSLLSY